MKNQSLLTLAAVFIWLAPWSKATVYECNNDPCMIKKVVIFNRITCNGYETTFTCEHYLGYNECVYLADGTQNDCWFTYTVQSITNIPNCGSASVGGIIGLPDVVCVGETYELTAQADGPLSQGVTWWGDGTVLSQSGLTAIVSFPNPGASLVMYAVAAQGQSAPPAQAATSAPAVSYFFPDRGGNSSLPRSIPLNAAVAVSVSLVPALPPGKSLHFKIVGGSPDNGQAQISAPSDARLTGQGGYLSVMGTAQTEPGHSGNLYISTDTKPNSTCGYTVGFSVCAHPSQISKDFNRLIINEHTQILDPPAYRYWGVRYLGSFSPDGGVNFSLSKVLFREVVVKGSHTQFFANMELQTSDWGNFGAGGDKDDYAVGGNWTTASLNQAIVAANYQGEAVDYQHYEFACARCGMVSVDSGGNPGSPSISAAVPSSGFEIQQTLTSAAGVNYVVTRVTPHSDPGYGQGAVTGGSEHQTPIADGP